MVSKLVFLSIMIVMCTSLFAKNLKLKQVFIVSRHNMRNAIGKQLKTYSSKPWPPQVGSRGGLTPKGAQQEGYMGEYFSEWFKKEDFLQEGCPDENTVYVYANSKNRTIETARAFLDLTFKNCNVTVHHKNTTDENPLFHISVHNTTETYKQLVISEINRKLDNNIKLKAVYSELNEILDIAGSDVCKKDGICDLTEANNTIYYKVNEPVKIIGPFSIAHDVIDAFVSSYYASMPIEEIAWGQITTPEKWNLLTEIIRQYQDIRHTITAEDVAAPFIQYVTRTFKNYDEKPKLILLVGHERNIYNVLKALDFQLVDLPNQYENLPIGSKLVLQRWTDGEKDYLKVEYVYSSWSQLRDGSKYSLESPPQTVVMRLNWCNTDEQGFCLWQEFVDKL